MNFISRASRLWWHLNHQDSPLNQWCSNHWVAAWVLVTLVYAPFVALIGYTLR